MIIIVAIITTFIENAFINATIIIELVLESGPDNRTGFAGVIADLFRRANVPGRTHPLADMFRQNISASVFVPAGTSTRPRKSSGPRKRSASVPA